MNLRELTKQFEKITHWMPIHGGHGTDYYTNNCEQEVNEDQDIQNWDFSEYEISREVRSSEIIHAPIDAVIIQHEDTGKLIAVCFR